MKKILFIAFLVVVYQSVCISQIDTMGKFPYFFYYNWPELGAMHNGIQCRYSVGYSFFPQSGSDYLVRVGGNLCEFAAYHHTDDTIQAIGLAVCWGSGYQHEATEIVLYDSAMNKIASVSRNYFGSSPSTNSDLHHFYYPGLLLIGDSVLFYQECGYTYMYYDFFKDTSFRLTGDFYIGIKAEDTSIFLCTVAFPQPVFINERHDSPFNFHSAYKLNIDGVWHDTLLESNDIPLLFVIQMLPCEPLDSVSLVAGTDGCLQVNWEAPELQSSWTVSLTLPDGSEIVQPTDTNHWEYCGITPGAYYRVKIRSRCDDLNGHSWSEWSREFSIGNPQAIAETALPTLDVRPNPTDGTVLIPAEGIREVWCVAADGRRSRLEVKDSQVSLKGYPAGLYVLEIQTDEGLYTAKVVRK